jgi:ASPIC and UnbV/FG-GAP-like repeat
MLTTRGIAAAVGAVAMACCLSACSLGELRSFGPAGAAPIPKERLFDLGVADFNEDGRLDMFAVNHKFRGAMLENAGGRFRDVTTKVGGDPDPDFPGLEDLRAPPMKERGVYLYMTDSTEGDPGLLHIRTVGIRSRGKIGFLTTSLRILRANRAKLSLGRNSESVRTVGFDARPGAAIVVDPSSVADVPMAAFFDQPSDPGRIRVGAEAVPATEQDFRLTLRDRHAIAFADLAGDPGIDAFVISGGLGGGIVQPAFRDELADELLVGSDGGFAQTEDARAWKKGGCRGRQVEAVDVNGDGLLDLFESCEGRAPKIYRQTEPGRFGKLRAPPAVGTSDRWIDLGRGEPPSLLVAGDGRVEVWQRAGGGWRRTQSVRANAGGDVAQLAVGDVDGDRDLDVLATSTTGNTMLRNDHGRLVSVPLDRSGVPAASAAASFVDYDDDGAVDLYTVPQGLLRNDGRRFRPTGQLTVPAAGAAIVNWADFDDDGLRDPVIAFGHGEFASRMGVRRARNITPIHGHWLEVDLAGTAGNRQAIGAWVEARAGRMKQVQWVGQNDDAPHSEGHYRLYFGLGLKQRVDSLVVHWPDGQTSSFREVAADQVLHLEQ